MKKELLTKDKIILDLEALTKAHFKGCFKAIPIFIFLYFCFLPLFCFDIVDFFNKSIELIDIIFFAFIFVGINFIIFIIELIKFISRKKAIKTEDFVIITDWLTEKRIFPKRTFYYHHTGTPKEPSLIFARSGKFLFSETIYYSWSSLFPFDCKDLFRTSEINQDFYVIRFKNKKPFLIYNKKYFEMEEKNSP